MDYKKLADQAKKAKGMSYSPYSKFRVGAALLTQDGKVYRGANVENASYGLTMCAERTAAFAAKIAGENDFSAIAIASDSKDFIPPCGACRQVLLELCGKELDVIITNGNDEQKVFKVKDLIPFSFGDEQLNKS
ncbi:MAG: cytidine deaminase [Chlorobi bacterium]|nr:cytidine deaminase [Chlorobiota bacterium]